MPLDMGTPRSVAGNFVSALAGTGAMSTSGKKKRQSVKKSFQTGIAAASSIAAANYIGEGRYVKAVYSFCAGAGGVYILEKLYSKKAKKMSKKSKKIGKKLKNGKNGLSFLDTNFGFTGGDFVVGALVGAAVTYVLTNKEASAAVMKTLAKSTNFLQAGFEELKERFEDAKAEVQTENKI
ncbi:MAG: hypothetical protein LBS26_04480 [Campylobacteraceae bacterium]|jgi:hypothetical protein|nr:hypothetical protein [Campylobacteraceae bacterium]